MTGYRYGRTAARFPVGTPFLHRIADLPPAPDVFDHSNGWDRFEMLGNGPDPTLTAHRGPVGDCAFAGTVNAGLLDAVECGEQYAMPSSNEVVTTYLTYDHGQDQGANLVDLLQFWHLHGLPWGGKIAGWASVDPHDRERFWDACNAFGCLYIGIAVPSTMDGQVENGQTLDLTGTDADSKIMGGHCVVVASRTETGGELVTWGQRVPFTQRWADAYIEEAHVVITPQQLAKGGDGYGLNVGRLQSILADL